MLNFFRNLTKQQRLTAIISVCIALALIIIVPVSVSASRSAEVRRKLAAAEEAAARAAQNTTVVTTQKPTTTTEPVTEPPYVPLKFADDMYPLMRDDKWGVVNENGDVIADFLFEGIDDQRDTEDTYLHGNGYGYMMGDRNLPHSFGSAFAGGLLIAWGGKGWGLVDANGRIIVPMQYQKYIGFSDGLYLFKNKGEAFFYDEKGKLALKWGGAVNLFSNGLAADAKGGYYGFIDTKGRTVIDYQFSTVCNSYLRAVGYPGQTESPFYTFVDGLIGVSVNSAYGVINTKGEYVIPLGQASRSLHIYDKNLISIGSSPVDLYDHDGNFLKQVDMYGGGVFPVLLNGGSVLAGVNSGGTLFLNMAGEEIARSPICHEGKANDKWLKTGSNLMDTQGNIFFTEPARYLSRDCSVSLGLVKFRKSENGSTNKHWVYDWDRTLLLHYSGEHLDFWNTYYALAQNSNAYYLEPLRGGQEYKFNSVKICNDQAAIVQDEAGAYYGIFVNDKMRIPMEYNNISYGAGEIFTLTKGSETTHLFIARNGRVIDLDAPEPEPSTDKILVAFNTN